MYLKKKTRKNAFLFVTLLISAIYLSALDYCYAGDIDDGIKTDDISNTDELIKNINISYIKRYAKTVVSLKKGKDAKKSNNCTQGSAIIEPGAKVRDIFVITDSKGNTVYCNK